jgi:plastocyanin
VTVVDPAAASNVGAAADGRSAGVSIIDLDFDPKSVTVTSGGTVSWTNTGKAKHTASARDGSWTSPLLAFGQRFEHTFEVPGTYEYYCTLHPNMVGRVVVTDASGDAAPGKPDTGSSGLTTSTLIVSLMIGGTLLGLGVLARSVRDPIPATADPSPTTGPGSPA